LYVCMVSLGVMTILILYLSCVPGIS